MKSAENEKAPSICLLGVGNTLRGDDGIGCFVCKEFEKLNASRGVEIRTSHQLHIELAAELQGFQKVIIVDASMEGEDLHFFPLDEQNTSGHASSHAIDALFLSNLAQKLFPSQQTYYLCAVKGSQFGFGETLSSEATKNAAAAIELISTFIQKESLNS